MKKNSNVQAPLAATLTVLSSTSEPGQGQAFMRRKDGPEVQTNNGGYRRRHEPNNQVNPWTQTHEVEPRL